MSDIQQKIKSILIIDDDESVLHSIEMQLKHEDVELMLTQNPLDALHMINDRDIDLIISDVKMRPIDGLEVLKKVKISRPQIRVIIITAFIDDEIEDKARYLGSSDFLLKPIRKKELIEAINKVPRVY